MYEDMGDGSKLLDGLGLDGNWKANDPTGCAITGGKRTQGFSLELPVPRIVTKVQLARRMDCCVSIVSKAVFFSQVT